jgi:hypothetical protein
MAASVLISGCATFAFESEPFATARPTKTPRPTALVSPSAAATHAGPTAEPPVVAGPPFARPAAGVTLVDQADVFSAETEQLAAARIAAIDKDHDAQVIVYTQVKPGSNAQTTERDAVALKLQWRLPDGIVIMWNQNRETCLRGATDNAQILLYAGTRFSVKRMSALKRDQIYVEQMLPLLVECNDDDALLAALDAIATDIRAPTTGPSTGPSDPGGPTSTKGACGDPAFEVSGYRWESPFEWVFNESSVPSDYDADDVLDVLTRSVENITNARNDCGLPDKVDATATYEGTTTRAPCETDTSDGYNTVGFAELPDDVEPDTLAFACPYAAGGEMVEVDILINSAIPWALSEQTCKRYEELLEATMTHEFGHVFGLSHVSERTHGDLTMSPTSNGPCDAEEITLGLGDVLGLQELY